nr:MAG TPA: hypothetical protein [Caudoviricetes sp.]
MITPHIGDNRDHGIILSAGGPAVVLLGAIMHHMVWYGKC